MTDTDEHLAARVRAGDMSAFDVLYGRYEARVFSYVRAIVGDRADAEEVFHDAFMAALREAPELVASEQTGQGGFRAWIYRVARNKALNHRRASVRRERALSAAAAVERDAASREGERARADRALEQRELDQALSDAVERLPELLGELFHLRTSGLSYEQMAEIVEVPVGTVKSRMHQMVHTLREELEPWIAPK